MIQKKMMFAALAAILLGVCIACNAPQQDKQRKDLTKTKKSMTNKELKEKLTLALEDMKAKAIEMGIHGVAVASVLNNGDSADNDYTTQVLYRYGFQWPITARSYVHRFVDTIIGFDYFKS